MAKNDQAKPAAKTKSAPRRPLLRRLLFWLVLMPVVVVYLIGLLISFTATRAAGRNVRTPAMRGEIVLKSDTTGVDAAGRQVLHQENMDTLLKLIADAGDTLILDQFLVNEYRSRGFIVHRDITADFVAALVAKKRLSPNTWILLITDPINASYGEECPPALKPLVAAGVHVVMTDLDELPDINWLYSPFFRTLAPIGRRLPWAHSGIMTNPFAPDEAKLSWMDAACLLNFKANHRKVAVCRDASGQYQALVTSANPHSASSANGNLGVWLRNGPCHDIAASELALARGILLYRPELAFSRANANEVLREVEARLEAPAKPTPLTVAAEAPVVRYCTETAIATTLEEMLSRSGKGDVLQLMMFYLADPGIVRDLKAAAQRGAQIRILLDPNKDAFGREKHGVPNQAVAQELRDWAAASGADVQIRWFVTHGEQGHFKSLRIFNPGSGRSDLLLGSANFTVRNLRGSNLEAAIAVENAGAAGRSYADLFDRLWDNRDGVVYSAEFAKFEVQSGWKYHWKRALTAFGNWTGCCTY